MAKQVDSSNIGGLLEALITKIKAAFWRKSETSELSIDNAPTSGSNNLVKSGGVYSALADKYEKPSTGIPASDLASGVIPDVSNFITKSVNDLVNYYTKSQTYTQAEVNSLIGAISQFHYEIAASTSAVVSPASNVLYLIGPTGSGVDKYEEYVYPDSTTGWVKIGDTSIDLSGYVTTQALNTALAAYTTTSDLTTLLAGKQDTIDAQHKLDYSLIANTPTIPTEVFVATYGTTTQSEILAAVAAGQLPVCKYGDNLYVYAGESSADYLQFTSVLYNTAYRIYVKNSTWGSGSYEVYSKPSGGIPASDLADGVIPTVPTDIVKYTAQTLTDAQKTQARTNIGAKESEVFWAEYSVTTFDDIKAASDAGKVVMVKYADQTAQVPYNIPLATVGENDGFGVAGFCISLDRYSLVISVMKYGGQSVWIEPRTIEYQENKLVSSWQSTPDNDHYPSEKLVKDSLDGKQPTIDASHKLDYSLVSNTPTIPTTYAGSPSAGGPANKALGIPFGNVDSTSTATVMTATVDNFPTTLTAGVCAYIRNDIIASASGWTLNINGTGALPVYSTLSDASRVTTIFSAASTHLFIYNPTRVDGGCWDLFYGYNSDTNTIGYNLRTGAATPPTASKFYRYRILFTSQNGQSLIPANTSSSTNATAARAVNQAKIDPFGPIFYYSTTAAVEANAFVGAAYAWLQYSGIALGYSFNRVGAALTMTAKDPVYIKCAPQTDGSAIIDADTPFVQALPSTEDGKIYIYLGLAESATAITMYYWHPIYYYKDGAIRLWTNASATSADEEVASNKVTSLSSSSTDTQYPSAKCVYDLLGDVETLINAL